MGGEYFISHRNTSNFLTIMRATILIFSLLVQALTALEVHDKHRKCPSGYTYYGEVEVTDFPTRDYWVEGERTPTYSCYSRHQGPEDWVSANQKCSSSPAVSPSRCTAAARGRGGREAPLTCPPALLRTLLVTLTPPASRPATSTQRKGRSCWPRLSSTGSQRINKNSPPRPRRIPKTMKNICDLTVGRIDLSYLIFIYR